MSLRAAHAAIGITLSCALAACGERPPVESTQLGYRGTGMVQIDNPRREAAVAGINAVPDALPRVSSDGPRASEVYQNVQVLGDLSVAEFARVMAAITTWVSPEQGCTYCHAGDDLAAEAPYTKIVSRRMLQMTRDINTQWTAHVGETGVTCYTCHRGEPVPADVWYHATDPVQARGPVGYRAGQNAPGYAVGLTSLPYDPFSAYLESADEVRVLSEQALPVGNGVVGAGASIKQTEETYGLMMHMSQALGVNCTYCHNTRSFASWELSRAPRVTAWHGIRLARTLNEDYLVPLQGIFPANRLGPTGDVPKIGCGTCHRGAEKPLLGVSMVTEYPELVAPRPAPAAPSDYDGVSSEESSPGEAASGDDAPTGDEIPQTS